jgi:uncharacterized protein (TIGR00661 family)
MKILYAIQGTGNGHISRALEIVPILKKKADTHVLVSASQWELKLPFEIDYKLNGLGFVFGKKGGVDIVSTYLKMNTTQLLKEIRNFPIEQYDLVISDFEPVSCWAAKLKKKVCIGLSNQAASLHPLAPKPDTSDTMGKLILEKYAPCTYQYGYHFKRFDENVYTPIIRKEIRESIITNEGHITIYLPAYDDELIIDKLKSFKQHTFHVFSKHTNKAYNRGNFKVFPLQNTPFIKSMVSSNGIICNAGFGTTAEALFLEKKLIVIPMKTQYEQQCNAAVLSSMGVSVISSLKKKNHDAITEWLKFGRAIHVNYPDQTEELLDKIIKNHAGEKLEGNNPNDFDFLRRILTPTKLAASF